MLKIIAEFLQGLKINNTHFPGSLVVKNLPEMQETQVRSLGWEEALDECMATNSSTLAWRIQ